MMKYFNIIYFKLQLEMDALKDENNRLKTIVQLNNNTVNHIFKPEKDVIEMKFETFLGHQPKHTQNSDTPVQNQHKVEHKEMKCISEEREHVLSPNRLSANIKQDNSEGKRVVISIYYGDATNFEQIIKVKITGAA